MHLITCIEYIQFYLQIIAKSGDLLGKSAGVGPRIFIRGWGGPTYQCYWKKWRAGGKDGSGRGAAALSAPPPLDLPVACDLGATSPTNNDIYSTIMISE